MFPIFGQNEHKSPKRLTIETLAITATIVGLAIGVMAIIALAQHTNVKNFLSSLASTNEFKLLSMATFSIYAMVMILRCTHYYHKP